jgi:hypothetical protein
MKFLGVSVVTIIIVIVALWVGYKYGAKIPVLSGM